MNYYAYKYLVWKNFLLIIVANIKDDFAVNYYFKSLATPIIAILLILKHKFYIYYLIYFRKNQAEV